MRKVSQALVVGLICLVIIGLLFLAQSNTIGRQQVIEAETTPAPAAIPPETEERLLKEQEKLAKEMLEQQEIRQVSGPESAGSIIHINGKELKLKDDVYVEEMIVAITCVQGRFCPETPFYALRIKDTDSRIGVVVEDGTVIDDQHAQLEEQERTREKFQWLIDELEGKE